jgi:hypothetical protein
MNCGKEKHVCEATKCVCVRGLRVEGEGGGGCASSSP